MIISSKLIELFNEKNIQIPPEHIDTFSFHNWVKKNFLHTIINTSIDNKQIIDTFDGLLINYKFHDLYEDWVAEINNKDSKIFTCFESIFFLDEETYLLYKLKFL